MYRKHIENSHKNSLLYKAICPAFVEVLSMESEKFDYKETPQNVFLQCTKPFQTALVLQ